MLGYSNLKSEISAWWLSKGQGHINRIRDLQSEQATLSRKADHLLGKEIGFNIFGLLAYSWNRVTKVPAIDKKIDELKAEEDHIKLILSQKAILHADNLTIAVAGQDPKVSNALTTINSAWEPLKEQRALFISIKSKTDSLLRTIHKAWEEADDAQDWETLDMFGSNAGFTLLSHMETSEAAEHLEKVSTGLAEYKEFMSGMQEKLSSLQITPLRSEAILETAEWDLWMGILDLDIISFFTSWENHEQLGKAKTKLGELENQIQPIVNQSQDALSKVGRAIDEVSFEYANLRLSVVKDEQLPSNFYDYLPREDSKGHKRPSVDQRPSI